MLMTHSTSPLLPQESDLIELKASPRVLDFKCHSPSSASLPSSVLSSKLQFNYRRNARKSTGGRVAVVS